MALERNMTAGKIAIYPKAIVSARYVNQAMQQVLSANKNLQGIMQHLWYRTFKHSFLLFHSLSRGFQSFYSQLAAA